MLSSLLRQCSAIANNLFLFIATVALLSSCVQHRYYVSPFNGNHSTYHPIPAKASAVTSGYYVAGAVAVGDANDRGVDNVFAFHTTISGGHNAGAFQAFYSLGFSAGNYKVDSANGVSRPGNKGFGGAGFEGGFNVVVPFSGGEWRVIGVETSLRKEFGNYLQFRNALPDGAADPSDAIDLVIKNNFFGTLGGYTELIIDADATLIGLRLAAGPVLGKRYRNTKIYDDNTGGKLAYAYVTGTAHLTRNRYTGFMQLNLATKASGVLFGLNYRITK